MIIFEVSRNDWPTPAVDFDLGELEISIESVVFSTKNLKKQSCMIYLSLAELLDGLNRLEDGKSFDFVAADSSFSLLFKKKKGFLHITHRSENIVIVDFNDFIFELLKGIEIFFRDQNNVLNNNSAIKTDILDAIKKSQEKLTLGNTTTQTQLTKLKTKQPKKGR